MIEVSGRTLGAYALTLCVLFGCEQTVPSQPTESAAISEAAAEPLPELPYEILDYNPRSNPVQGWVTRHVIMSVTEPPQSEEQLQATARKVYAILRADIAKANPHTSDPSVHIVIYDGKFLMGSLEVRDVGHLPPPELVSVKWLQRFPDPAKRPPKDWIALVNEYEKQVLDIGVDVKPWQKGQIADGICKTHRLSPKELATRICSVHRWLYTMPEHWVDEQVKTMIDEWTTPQ